MKIIFLLISIMFLLPSCAKNNQDENENDDLPMVRSYEFSNGIIPQNVLESYLSRSITQAEFLSSEPFYNDGVYPDPDDDTRMLLNVGAKFIGRSIYSWNFPEHFNYPDFLGNAKTKIDELHRIDPEIVFQAAIFEIVSTKVEVLTIPDWVFEAFDLPFEERNFNYSNMLNKEGLFVDHWGKGASVPDISRIETQMFFYFMACKYMEIGIEAIHFGQVELMAMQDTTNYACWSSLLQKVRNAALDKARRGTIICDGHLPSGGIVIDGKHIFDFVSFPLRPKEIIGDPQMAELKKFYLDAMYGRTKGGITPSGWTCDRLPYLVEFDNWGISDHPGEADINDIWVWGYDEISWFSNQPEEYRNYFLHYTVDWIKNVDPVGYLQMPGSRVTTGSDAGRYRANTKSENCKVGKNQEETIKKIWEELN
jgi:hypothetical protein